jgi:hypothetical protein
MPSKTAFAAAAACLLFAGAAHANSSITVSSVSASQNGKTFASTTVVTNGHVQVFPGVSSISVFGKGNQFAVSFPSASNIAALRASVNDRIAALRERIVRQRAAAGR